MEPELMSERTPLFSKPVVDPVNTVAWFAMDGLWLAKLPGPAYVCAAVTVVTGVLLVVLGRREGRGAVYADLGLNCWIAMNTVWMLNDLNGYETPPLFAAVVAALGVAFFVAALRHSKDLRRVRIFKR